MRSTTEVFTSLMKSPTTSAGGDADPWPQMHAHQAETAAVKRSTSDWVAWGRSSTWTWGRPQRAWLHLALPSRSWERMAPRAWGPTTRMTSAFTRGHWGQGSTPQWHCPHGWGWWVWMCTESDCMTGLNETEGLDNSNQGLKGLDWLCDPVLLSAQLKNQTFS